MNPVTDILVDVVDDGVNFGEAAVLGRVVRTNVPLVYVAINSR